MLSEIYFIDIKALAEKLHAGKVSEKVALWHFILQAVLLGSGLAIPIQLSNGNEDTNLLLEISTFLSMAIIQAFGYSSLYNSNLKVDGKDFFLRYAALSLPASIHLLAISMVFAVFFGFAISQIEASKFGDAADAALATTVTSAFTILYFYLVNNGFKYMLKASTGSA